MKPKIKPVIFTIGHSTHSLHEFVNMLNSFQIQLLVDIRRYPGSRKYPEFNKDKLIAELPQFGISYFHLLELGGRRKRLPESKNDRWRKDSFRGYADYMATMDFMSGIHQLQELAKVNRVAMMCAEAVWWRCHRALISDFLKVNGWEVFHIMGIGKAAEHPYTSAALIKDNHLSYSNEQINL